MTYHSNAAASTPTFNERRTAMLLAQRYLSAANRTAFAERHGLTPDSLAIRYANVLPDLMERYDRDEAQAKADELVCLTRPQDEWEPA